MNFLDISGIVGRFRGIATAPALAATDIDPAVPNRMVDFADITLAVDEFRYDDRPYVGPVPCP